MARKISISFKEIKKDIELFEYLNSLEDKSTEMKIALRNYFFDNKPDRIEPGKIEPGKIEPGKIKKKSIKDDINVFDF